MVLVQVRARRLVSRLPNPAWARSLMGCWLVLCWWSSDSSRQRDSALGHYHDDQPLTFPLALISSKAIQVLLPRLSPRHRLRLAPAAHLPLFPTYRNNGERRIRRESPYDSSPGLLHTDNSALSSFSRVPTLLLALLVLVSSPANPRSGAHRRLRCR
jgi:hypothetical protein